ncbi:MAG: hypothetical protein LBG79_04710 [Spirochaetaceae bacterium]|nr:hypothetical protein [Spirochaetaceae bacterium]
MKKKKLRAFIFIILVAGVMVFFRGWLQLSVPEGSFGIMRSRTHGLYEKVICGGGFDWAWYRIIPWNTSLKTFVLEPSTFNLNLSGKLPFADTLGAFTGISGDYLWRLSGSVLFSIRPEALPGLVSRNAITSQEALEQWLDRVKTGVNSYAAQRLSFYFESAGLEQEKDFAAISKDGTSNRLKQDIFTAYPYFEQIECRITIEKLPDFNQWRASMAVWETYLETQRSVLQGEATTQAARKIASQFRFDELTRYGELLTKYPVLLKYLEIEKKSEGRFVE